MVVVMTEQKTPGEVCLQVGAVVKHIETGALFTVAGLGFADGIQAIGVYVVLRDDDGEGRHVWLSRFDPFNPLVEYKIVGAVKRDGDLYD